MCDFGFAKKVYADRTYTRCGTPDYTSPEMLRGEGVNQAIDCSLLDACCGICLEKARRDD